MRDRSFGVTTLAFSSVMVALYCQFAAIMMILTGSVFTAAGSFHAGLTLVNGAGFLGLTVAAYAVGYGFWTRKHWSWAGGLALFVSFVAANVALSLLSTNPINSLLPAIGSGLAIWFLYRPSVKAELLGTEASAAAAVPVTDHLKMPGAVH